MIEGDSLYPPAFSATTAHQGWRSLRLGILPPAADGRTLSAAFQALFIPVDAVSAELTFWYEAHTEDDEWSYQLSFAQSDDGEAPAGEGPLDYQEVLILDTAHGFNVPPDVVMHFNSDSQVWTQGTYDLMPYRGHTIHLHFKVYNNGWWGRRTWMFVDDVSAIVCRNVPTAPDP